MMSIIADTLNRLQSIRQKDKISGLPSPTPGTFPAALHPLSSSLRKTNPLVKSGLFALGVIIPLTGSLGLGAIIWSENHEGTEKSPAYPEKIAYPY